jgi:hypothetical protein
VPEITGTHMININSKAQKLLSDCTYGKKEGIYHGNLYKLFKRFLSRIAGGSGYRRAIE